MIRQVRTYGNYEAYVEHQLEKTGSSIWRKHLTKPPIWKDRLNFFQKKFDDVNIPVGRGLGVGARMGQEVQAMKNLGFDAIGIDLHPCPPLVIEGDMHNIPFQDEEFDFTFCNSLDHSLYPFQAISEIKRVTKPGGRIMLHLTIGSHGNHEAIQIDDPQVVLNCFDTFVYARYMKPWKGMNYELLIIKKR